MKVTKQMLHEDLRHTYRVLSLIPSLMRFKGLIKLVNRLTDPAGKGKDIDGLVREEKTVPSRDGEHAIRVVIYRPERSTERLPAMLYIHGGGYITGNPEQAAEIIERFAKARPCVIIAPDYRKAFTKPFPAGFDDCYETLLWAKAHAEELNILPDKFIVAGHSAGGGLTAAVTLKARDTGDVDIAFQMPIYPMIDDTQPSDPERAISTPVWDTRLNALGWSSYLSDLLAEGADIPAYAAPARNSDYQGFPPTITFVGTLEPFYWETAAYVKALRDAQIDVLYEEYEGCYHAFELLGGEGEVSRRARAFTTDSFADFYDRYALNG